MQLDSGITKSFYPLKKKVQKKLLLHNNIKQLLVYIHVQSVVVLVFS